MDGKALVKAWNDWANSPEGKACLQGRTEGQYLENRLRRAFMAGAKVADAGEESNG